MQKIIAGNWKMNNTVEESLSLIKELKSLVKEVKDKEIIVCPPFTSLSTVAKELKDSKIRLGAQNLYFEQKGAFTGEISPLMLKDICVEYVIIGHSERRHILKENDERINKKMKSALANDLKPIFCVGETLKQRETGKTKDIVKGQITKGLAGIKDIRNIIIAYEPVWAIGTGKNATPGQAEEVHLFIRKLIKAKIPILYGGSVNPKNIKDLISQKDIDGVLVGGASLNAKDFSQIVKC